MSFVYPNFLWALLLLIIPIIIHLFNFRKYKTVYFSKVDFLNEVIEDSKSGNKLKHLLILLSRLLMITALVFAFAQPFIPLGENQKTENVTSIYIDNSFSMQATGQDGDLLNEVKNKAIDVIKSFDENEKINLLTSDLLAKDQRFYSKSEIIDRIKEIDLSPASKPLSTVLNLQTDLINNVETEVNKRILLFSDFQASTSELKTFNKTEIPTFFYQPKAEINGNVFIDSVWFESPVQQTNLPIEVYFRIVNQTENALNDLKVTLKINENDKAWSNVNIAANSSTENKISFTNTTSGLKKGQLHINTNQLFFDDDYYFTYNINETVNILLITENKPAKNLEQLYILNDFYNYEIKNINTVNQEDFDGKDLIILQNINNIPSGINDKLQESLKDGSSISLIAGDNVNLSSWNSFLTTQNLPSLLKQSNINSDLNYFNGEDPLYYGVFEKHPENYKFAKVETAYPLNISPSNNFVSLFGYNSTNPFLIYSKALNGRIFLQTAPIKAEFSDFQNHALFAATYLRIAETSTLSKKMQFSIGEIGSKYPLYKTIDEKNQIHLLNSDYKVDVIPSVINSSASRYITFDQITAQINKSGFYILDNKLDFKDEIAFNYSRKESEIKNFTIEEIVDNFETINWPNIKLLEVNNDGNIELSSLKATEYWRILLILALGFMAIEILLLKLWKTK